MRRDALDAVKLTVFETDAVTGRRSSIVLTEGAILEAESIFEQIERFLPFDQWDALELHKHADVKKTHKSTLYVKKQSGVSVDEQLKNCRQLLDVDMKDEILTRCRLGYELALFKISACAAHKQFVIQQSHAWMCN
jgi:hypothetical protein